MCAIAGVVGFKDSQGAGIAVKKMVAALARRGPDGEGIFAWEGATFGHRRLAIFDLSAAGRQPMLTPDGAVGTVFNGAIYNFRELRDELIAHGYNFASQTDTEVLLHGYVQWGIDELVRRLRGMFAFALWDSKNRRCYLVRDRLGVKPLVYVARAGALAFASTVRGLTLAGFADELNGESVREFLIGGFLADDRSIFKDVKKLPAASILEWSEGRLAIRQYWNLPTAGTRGSMSFPDVVDRTRSLLLEAVEMRLHADVEVAALLSGGVDSSLICWAVQKLGSDITAFTVATPEDPWDETAEAGETARRLGLKHRIVEVAPHDLSDVAELASAYAEPFGSASALGMLGVSRAISSSGSVRVLLTGDGGDDAFLGYHRQRNLWIASNVARCLPKGVGGWGTLARRLPSSGPLRRAGALLRYATGGLNEVVQHSRHEDILEAEQLIGERFEVLSGTSPDLRTSGPNVLTDFLEYERRTRFVGEYMTKVDNGAMHYGIEARSPFLDHRIWEFAAEVPYGVRLHSGRLKAVLRELVRRELGDDVARRPKKGFGIPVQRWIVGRWRPAIEEMFRNSILEDEKWIRRGAALARLSEAEKHGAPVQLWYVVALESWLRYQRGVPVI